MAPVLHDSGKVLIHLRKRTPAPGDPVAFYECLSINAPHPFPLPAWRGEGDRAAIRDGVTRGTRLEE